MYDGHNIFSFPLTFCFPRVKFPISKKTDKGKKRKADQVEDKEEDMTLVVEPYVTPNRGPYPYNQPKRLEIKVKPETIPIYA